MQQGKSENTFASRRKFIKSSTLLAGGFLLRPKFEGSSIYKQQNLTAVVLGDSCMWGQGLKDEDKFALKALNSIGQKLSKQLKITNFSHSGAAIEADKIQRKKFANTYPALFVWTDFKTGGTSPQAESFVNDGDEAPTMTLYQDVPSTFPTITYQIDRVSSSTANNAEIVLINGGANDLDFSEFLDPEENRTDFVNHFESRLRDVTYDRVKRMLKKARQTFPNAVIIYTGYFSPFAPDTSNDALRNLFEHMSGEEKFLVRANRVYHFKPVNQYVQDAQSRSLFGLTRGLFYTRKAIAELNDQNTSDKGKIIFVHPKFKIKNTVFAEDSFFHNKYKPSEVADDAKGIRLQKIPRKDLEGEMKDIRTRLVSGTPVSKDKMKQLLRELDGSKDLIIALQNCVKQNPSNVNLQNLKNLLEDELIRINRGKIASFLHPNKRGAQRYADEIVERFQARFNKINLANDLSKFSNISGDSEESRVRKVLGRYNLADYYKNNFTAAQLMIVDSIAIEVKTAPNSERHMFDNIYLNVGNGHRWLLNFPYFHPATPNIVVPRLQRQFEPGKTDFFTIDAEGMHLSEITQFHIEREEVSSGISKPGPWVPIKFTVMINGVSVLNIPFSGNLDRQQPIRLGFPKGAS